MRATATAIDERTVTLTVDGTTYTDVPVETWDEGGWPGCPRFLAASIEWNRMPAEHPGHEISNLEWPELETIEGLISDAIDRYQRAEHDNRYL